MTLRENVRSTIGRLAARLGVGEARAITGLIFEHLKGYSAVDMVLKGDTEVSDYIADKVDAIIARLLAGEPVQYILGEARWHGLRLMVNGSVLIPRPETSELVDMIIDRYGSDTDVEVLDLCTGSGCIAIALARALPFSLVTGVDISRAALDVARQNGRALKASVKWLEADVMSLDIGGHYDVIVSNPPYVKESERESMEDHVVNYEPDIALFVPDDDPLKFYKAILNSAPALLKAAGRIYFEINPLEASALRELMEEGQWREVTVVKDTHGRDRFMTALRPE